MPNPPFLPAVLVLAAGASTRMGRPKLLLPWRGTSVLGSLLKQWRRVGAAQIAVVTATGDAAIEQELDRLGFAEDGRLCNPHPEQGMFSSIRCAAAWSGWERGLTHWLIALGDQPHLRTRTLKELLDLGAAHRERVCQLSRYGRPRHPVLLPRLIFQRLKDSTDRDLKQFLASLSPAVVLQESDDPGLDLDIDRPQDYEHALKLIKRLRR